MINAFVVCVLAAVLFGIAGVDRALAQDWPFSTFYFGLVLVNGAMAWVEYVK